MNSRASLLSVMCTLLVTFVSGPGLRSAEPGPNAPARPSATAANELSSLERFLDLSDAELAQMADAIARLRAMTPAQRVALRQEIAAFRSLPEQERQQIRHGWGWMPPAIQDGWREMMQTATAEERAAIQARLHALPPEEKTSYRKQLVEAYLKAKAAKP